MDNNTITVVGNLTEDPTLRFTPSGAAVVTMRIASTPRHFDAKTSEWKDGDPLFISINTWRQQAENIAESLERGARVIVEGVLKMRSYETAEGEKRTVFEIEASEVGVSLKHATAKPVRNTARAASNTPTATQAQPAAEPAAQPAAPAAEPAGAPAAGGYKPPPF